MNQPVKPVPDGMTTVTPHLVRRCGRGYRIYEQAFDAVEPARLPDPNGRIMHAMIRIGDAPVMLVDALPVSGRALNA